MYEYVFFDEGVRDHFCSELARMQVEHQASVESTLMIEVSEEIDDAVSDAIDELFERLLQVTADLMEEKGEGLEKDVAGVQVLLADGAHCTIRLDPDLVSRMLTAISMEELRDLCQTITEGVERRDNSPLCHVLDT